MRPVDFHLHCDASEDSDAPIQTMCEAALRAGLEAVAITDHAEMVRYREDGYDLTVAQSWKQAGEMAEAYAGRLRVARGVELGEPLYDLATAESILRDHNYDFVLGSIHKLGDDVDYYEYDYSHRDVGESMDLYFDAVLELARWGRFHSLAHLTYPFRYMPADKRPADYRRWAERIDAILCTLAQKGLALEINTSGLRQAIRLTSPDYPLVRRFREVGGELITVGSDAHEPANVGAGIPEALAIARQAGFRDIAVFFAGKPEMRRID